MHLESIRSYCPKKAGTTESFPFDESTLVFKVMGKMFALIPLERTPPSMNLKCDPERSEELRASYEGIYPGFHMSKKHWNTVNLEEDVNSTLLAELIDHSYDLVVAKLTKAAKAELKNLHE